MAFIDGNKKSSLTPMYFAESIEPTTEAKRVKPSKQIPPYHN
jgi:hypothetical protein